MNTSEPSSPSIGASTAERGGADAPVEGAFVRESAAASLVQRLLAAHEAWFDVERPHAFGGREFMGFAQYHSTGERYVLSKRAKLWEVANHEFLFFHAVDHLDARTVRELVELLTTQGLDLVHPQPDHMSSNIALVIAAESVDPDVCQVVRRTRFRKNYRMGLWGWTDFRLAVVDMAGETRLGSGVRGTRRLVSGRVVTNAAGKVLKSTIESNLSPAANAR